MDALTKVLILFTLCSISISLAGCRGSAGKKAATEALEYIERKGASKAASSIEREASQVERSAAREAKGYNSGRTRTYRPRHSSYDGNESSYQPQVYTAQCSQCGGRGAVYISDYYGNIQYDYYGNPVISQCPSCGGTGSILVSE